ncbi:hypothetical protein J6590_049301 [Homalodisca vitripennis]|nr:hypothetical protein J6590_049301 [Homalodisca vitripennis]
MDICRDQFDQHHQLYIQNGGWTVVQEQLCGIGKGRRLPDLTFKLPIYVIDSENKRVSFAQFLAYDNDG